MANYYTLFSCELDVKTPDNARRAMALYEADEGGGEFETPMSSGFELAVDETSPATLWIYSDHSGDVECVIRFVRSCVRTFGLTGRWGFQYAQTCSRPTLSGFGGGAHVIDLGTGENVDFVSTDEWLVGTRDGGCDATGH